MQVDCAFYWEVMERINVMFPTVKDREELRLEKYAPLAIPYA